MSRRRAADPDERASGLLSSVIGIGIIVALLGLASNVAIGLWTRSVVDSIAYDAARRVATAPVSADRASAERAAIDDARRSLGVYGQRVEMDFEHSSSADVVTLRVRAPGVSLLPAMIGGGPVVGDLDRRIVIRREAP